MLFLEEIYSGWIGYTKERRTYHDNFCVKKNFIPEKHNLKVTPKVQDCNLPAPRINWGKAPVRPKESGSHAVSHLFPNFVSKNRWPKRNWRTRLSPDGILESFSTHEPPIGWNLPSRTFSFTRSKRGGYSYQIPVSAMFEGFDRKKKVWNTCSSHLYCCAELHENLCSGYRSMRSSWVDHERATFCCVTRYGQSHAVSIWQLDDTNIRKA